MKQSKKSKAFAEMVESVSQMSKKDYRDLWRITRQYRKADKMLIRSLDRQEREIMLPKKSNNDSTIDGLNYEFA
ncbi:MAG: hypothetical protein J6X18_03390 [Bacteroidales bacterium]|nr:hypothetical protein [Bacteroidales bacterium]